MVGIVMGSDSDLPVMQEAAKALAEFGISYEVTVVSAHRTPHRAAEYAETAEARGLNLIIAGAGGAAHLAGVMASLTPLPVIGIPVKSAALNGLDSLLSTVQMPPGVPVATVGIDAARNAGILAAQILGASDTSIREKVKEFKAKLARQVDERNAKVQEQLGR
ncbi:MAG: 5-(carboxyamino)imidazole ribonucleotide mutase [Armatimonadetes bacterium]|nr:5-(carboxyamino)imidazole ribonucleotide mutase [Armatimonadota bacterium]